MRGSGGGNARRANHMWLALLERYVRRRPTLPPRHQGSTIGAERLSFRVRNVTGRFPLAMAAVTLWRYIGGPPRGGGGTSIPDRISGTAQWTRVFIRLPEEVAVCGQALGLLVQV